jgi:hypothetical protein
VQTFATSVAFFLLVSSTAGAQSSARLTATPARPEPGAIVKLTLTAPASGADRDAKIEQLLLVGLDHYFANRYELSINELDSHPLAADLGLSSKYDISLAVAAEFGFRMEPGVIRWP